MVGGECVVRYVGVVSSSRDWELSPLLVPVGLG